MKVIDFSRLERSTDEYSIGNFKGNIIADINNIKVYIKEINAIEVSGLDISTDESGIGNSKKNIIA